MSRRSPNIVLVFADQMRGMDMRCAGNADMITPTFDRMASEGVRCTGGYATVPICGPNRACLLTGTYATRHGVLFNDQAVRSDLPSLGTLARDHGYRTGYVGKWHVDGPPRDKFTPPGPRRLGFDDFWAVYNCAHDYFDPKYYRDTPELIRVPGYEPTVQTDLALEFLDGSTRDDRPFCLVLSWGPPHNPYEQVPEPFRKMYDPQKITLRPNCRPIERKDLDPAWDHRPSTADYFALITSLDAEMARLMARLEAMGVADDTIVIFTSDHGDMMWSQGLLYKCVPYEESVSVPLLWRWPAGLPRGAVNPGLVGTVDLLPTLCGLAGWRLPQDASVGAMQGVDCSGVLRGAGDGGAGQNARPEGTGLVGQSSLFLAQYTSYVFRADQPTPAWRGVRTERYTYAESSDRKPWLVFDNLTDPYQMKNLANDAGHAGLRRTLHGELETWLKRVGDPFLDESGMQAWAASH